MSSIGKSTMQIIKPEGPLRLCSQGHPKNRIDMQLRDQGCLDADGIFATNTLAKLNDAEKESQHLGLCSNEVTYKPLLTRLRMQH